MQNPLDRIRLLMEYSPKLTHTENENKYSSKKIVSEQPTDNQYTTTVTDVKPYVTTNLPTYPEYCKYPDKAIIPPSKGNLSNKDLIKGYENYCYYPGHSQTGWWIGKDTEIEFYDGSSLLPFFSKIVEKYGYSTEAAKERLIKNLSKIFSEGVIRQFTQDGVLYSTWISTQDPPNTDWYFKGYFSQDGKPYKQPDWEDPRSESQRFIDEWGLLLQLSAAFGTALAGAISGGASWVLTVEIITEIVLGYAIGTRELERGENVNAILSFVTGMLPTLKISKTFRGVSKEVFDSLSKKLKNADLSSVNKYEEFYKTVLNIEEQKLLSKILEQDEITFDVLASEVSKEMLENFKKIAQKNPDLLMNVNFFERLWARELGANGLALAIGVIVEILWGKKLNDELISEFEEIIKVSPTELQKELVYNLLKNSEFLEAIMRTQGFEELKLLQTVLPPNRKDKWLQAMNDSSKKMFEEGGGTYYELPENSTIGVDDDKTFEEYKQWFNVNFSSDTISNTSVSSDTSDTDIKIE